MSEKLSSRNAHFFPLTVKRSQAATSDIDVCVDSDTYQTSRNPPPPFLLPFLCLSLDFKDWALVFYPQLMQEWKDDFHVLSTSILRKKTMVWREIWSWFMSVLNYALFRQE